MSYRFQEHSHPNTLVTDIGSTWWRVPQTKAEDHVYYMLVLSSRVRLKGRCYEVLFVKPIEFFWFSASMTEIPQEWLGFGNQLSWPYTRTVSRRDRREESSIITLKKEEKTFSDNKKSFLLSLIAVFSGLAECLSLVFQWPFCSATRTLAHHVTYMWKKCSCWKLCMFKSMIFCG